MKFAYKRFKKSDAKLGYLLGHQSDAEFSYIHMLLSWRNPIVTWSGKTLRFQIPDIEFSWYEFLWSEKNLILARFLIPVMNFYDQENYLNLSSQEVEFSFHPGMNSSIRSINKSWLLLPSSLHLLCCCRWLCSGFSAVNRCRQIPPLLLPPSPSQQDNPKTSLVCQKRGKEYDISHIWTTAPPSGFSISRVNRDFKF